MRNLYVLVLILVFSVLASGQRSVLTGTLYDALGAVIPRAKVTATNSKGDVFETTSNEDGVYTLNLAFNDYSVREGNFKEAKYDIVVYSPGFTRSVTKGFVFVPAYGGKMQLDVALEVGPCDDCHWIETKPVEPVPISNVPVTKEIRVRPTLTIAKPKKDN